MSTHNIGFYEEMAKLIFQLSLNIVKYTLYLFFWKPQQKQESLQNKYIMNEPSTMEK